MINLLKFRSLFMNLSKMINLEKVFMTTHTMNRITDKKNFLLKFDLTHIAANLTLCKVVEFSGIFSAVPFQDTCRCPL